MHIRLAVSIGIIVTGVATSANALSLCDTLTAMSRMEAASQKFLSSSSGSRRHDALREMATELSSIEDADLTVPVYDDIRAAVLPFVQSRRQVLYQAENFGLAAATVTARTMSYARHAEAFDAIYRPLRCRSPERTPSGNTAGAARITTSDPNRMSARGGFELSASMLAYSAIAILILSAAGLRLFLELKSRRKRRSKRFYCTIDTAIRKNGWRFDGRIHDISQVGCKLQSKAKLAAGESIAVTLLGTEQEGRIIWANRHYVGIEFSQYLNPGQVERIITAKPEKSEPRILGHGAR